MHLITKTTFTLVFGILFIFLAKSSLAQPPAFRGQVNRLLSNQEMNMNLRMQMQMHMNMRGVTVNGSGEECNFEVVLRDSTKKTITSAIYTDSATKKHFLIYIDKKYKKTDTNRYKKIYPSQTLHLRCVLIPKDENDELSGEYLPGIPTDSCWMFKVISGQINAYSFLVGNDGNPIFPETLVGLQLNNGPIISFSKENLQQMVGQDLDALVYIEKKKYVKAIKKYNQHVENAAENK